MKSFLVSTYLAIFVLAVVSASSNEQWAKVGIAESHDVVTFRLALKQQYIQEFEGHVRAISDPKSPIYGDYMSVDDILDIISPPTEVSNGIVKFLELKCPGSITVTNNRDSIKAEATVDCVTKLFSTPLYRFRHVSQPITVARLESSNAISIPSEISEHIEFVSGLNLLPRIRKSVVSDSIKAPETNDGQYSYNYVIPQTVRRMYNIPAGMRATNPKTTQSVVEFLPVGAPLISDLQQFDTAAGELFTNISTIVGPWTPGSDGESTLDIQYLSTVGAGADTWYITIADGWAYDMANTLFMLPSPPLVNSVSYGWPEENTCQSVTNANCTGITVAQYVARANTELAKVAARGISVLIASQDEGAPSEANEDCELDSTHPLWPIYPSSSPWVTAVSATTLIDTTLHRPLSAALPPICNMGYTCDTTGSLEMPCMENNTEYSWTTGGGFSKYAVRPNYQNAAVNQYLSSQSIIPPTQFFNTPNRGYPDVSAVGDRILIIIGGSISVTAGTSAATPIFSGVVTLLNDYRLNAGKKPLGFLNPLLYQMAVEHPAAFNLITMGNNKCSIGTCCMYGYGCNYQGWDPVTGLGVPNYQEMINYIKTLP